MNKLYIIFMIMVCCIGCDQFSKNLAEKTLKATPAQAYLGNLFRLQYAENTGAFLSMGAELPQFARTWLFTILSGGLLVALFIYVLTSRNLGKKHVFALSLILGGGSSNLIDRVLNDGRVVDFMNMGIGSLRTGIFNFADVVIMAGMGLIILYSLKARAKSKAIAVMESDESD